VAEAVEAAVVAVELAPTPRWARSAAVAALSAPHSDQAEAVAAA
jgi:hypothetical protein